MSDENSGSSPKSPNILAKPPKNKRNRKVIASPDSVDTLQKPPKAQKKSKSEMGDFKVLERHMEKMLEKQNLAADKLTALDSTTQNINTNMQTVMDDISNLKENVVEMSQGLKKVQSEVVSLQNDYDSLRADINNIQQSAQYTSFQLSLLPKITQDEAFGLMKKFVETIGGTVKKTDFKKLFVAQHRNQTSCHLIGAFYEERKRDEIFAKFRKAIKDENPILVEDICLAIATDSTLRGKEVRIKSLLTQQTKQLYDQARQFRNLFEYVWETDGRILMRKNKDSKAIEIKSHRQLVNVISAQQGRPHTRSDMQMDTQQ